MTRLSTEEPRDPRVTARRAATVGGTILLLAVVLPFVVFALPQLIGANYGFVILSGSMEPALSTGDVVIVDAGTAVGVGDVITFRDGRDVPTTHRVVEVVDGAYLTQGDANENPDPGLVSPADVLGEVTLSIPLIGYVILWANTPLGYVAFVVVPLLLLGASELYGWVRSDDGSESDDGAGSDDSVGNGAATELDDTVGNGATTGVDDGAGSDAVAGVDDATATPSTDGGSVSSASTEQAATARSVETAESAATQSAEETETEAATVSVAETDLTLSALAAGSLAAYAGWNVYGSVSVGSAPDPVAVAAATAGLFGTLAAAYVTVDGRRRASAARTAVAAVTEGAAAAPATDERGDETPADETPATGTPADESIADPSTAVSEIVEAAEPDARGGHEGADPLADRGEFGAPADRDDESPVDGEIETGVENGHGDEFEMVAEAEAVEGEDDLDDRSRDGESS
ncbi:signal peptidase I [Halobaculum sp. MBLA0147]|uniref:signal peptidase I n=1 Tax=Halobaculum sp. MBLA0147 TaxID=3079934 RepID=UPI00352442D5